MSAGLSESAIVQAVANHVSRGITRKVVSELQRMKHTLSGDDSEMQTTWDEICVQIQCEESFYWDVYDATVRAVVATHTEKLPHHERAAIWLQTSAGLDWQCDEGEDRRRDPVFDQDIIDYLTTEFIYNEAGRWSNNGIRAFIKQFCNSD